MTIEDWLNAGENIDFNGKKIFVMDSGEEDKPIVLMVHGFPTSSWDWQPMWQTLNEQYRLVAMDMLGFGYSDKPNHRNYTIHGQADVVETVVAAKGLNQFHLFAHDYGDTVAQEVLARHHEGNGVGTVLSCCFLNGGIFPETHRALLTQKLLLSPLGKLLNKFTGYTKFSNNFGHVFGPDTKPTEQQLQEFWTLINYNDGKHLFHNLITYMRDRKLHRTRWVEVLQQSRIPLSLINGSVDPISGAHMVARYQELECRLDYLAELPDIGHYPSIEAPADVARHYLAFLASISAAKS